MKPWGRVLVAALVVLAPAGAGALSVADCQRNCSVSRGSCDFDPSDSSRASGCRERESACKYECQLNGATSSNRPARFGAIAYSPAKRGHGITYDYGNRANAEAEALKSCQRLGATDCRVVIWFSNNCGSLATASDGTYGGGYSGNKVGAETRALYFCRNAGGRDCAVRRSFCTGN